jgi:hypothetical protein
VLGRAVVVGDKLADLSNNLDHDIVDRFISSPDDTGVTITLVWAPVARLGGPVQGVVGRPQQAARC